MYLGFVLILLGIAVLLGSLTPWLVIPIFVILIDRVFIQTEERMLAEQFGQAGQHIQPASGAGYDNMSISRKLKGVKN